MQTLYHVNTNPYKLYSKQGEI